MINLLLTKLLEILIRMGNWGVFLSAIGIFPTEIIMAILGAEKESNIWMIALASGLGEMVGGYPVYLIGKVLTGDKIYDWIDGKGRFLNIDRKKLDRNKKRVVKRSYIYIFFTRFVPYLRVVSSLASGVLELNLILFSLTVFLGSYIYSLLIAYMGYRVGGDLETITKYINLFDKWILFFTLLYIVLSVGLKHRKRIAKWINKFKQYIRNR